MKLCVDCFWYNDGKCMENNATVVSLVDGKWKQRTCDVQRGYDSLSDSCGSMARFWVDANTDVCSVCREPLKEEDSVGDDEPAHLNCMIGRAESMSEGDRR